MTTAADVLCNVLIFSQQAAVAYCVREILNGLEGEPGQALRKAAPYLAGILIVSLLRIAAILCCAALDARRSYYYQNRLRINILNKLLHKENVLSVSGRSGPLFEVLDDDVPTSTFPAELLTEVLGCFIFEALSGSRRHRDPDVGRARGGDGKLRGADALLRRVPTGRVANVGASDLTRNASIRTV